MVLTLNSFCACPLCGQTSEQVCEMGLGFKRPGGSQPQGSGVGWAGQAWSSQAWPGQFGPGKAWPYLVFMGSLKALFQCSIVSADQVAVAKDNKCCHGYMMAVYNSVVYPSTVYYGRVYYNMVYCGSVYYNMVYCGRAS